MLASIFKKISGITRKEVTLITHPKFYIKSVIPLTASVADGGIRTIVEITLLLGSDQVLRVGTLQKRQVKAFQLDSIKKDEIKKCVIN